MQYNINLDMVSISRWSLNVQQGVVFSFIHFAGTWADRAADDAEFFNVSNGKLVNELGCVTDKRDTMLRHVLKLVDTGVIERRTIRRKQYLRITEKGKMWNKVREENPASNEQRDISPASLVAQRDKNPASSGEQRDKFPASDEQRENNPGATGNISDVSVNQISVKSYDSPRPVDNSPVDKFDDDGPPAAPLAPPTMQERVSRVEEVFVAHGYPASTVTDERSQRIIVQWLRLGLGAARLKYWLEKCDKAANGNRPGKPVMWLEDRVNADLQGKPVDQGQLTAQRMRNVDKTLKDPSVREAALQAAGVKA